MTISRPIRTFPPAGARGRALWVSRPLALAVLVFGMLGRVVAAQVVTRGPYLQLQRPTSVVVRWRTDVATDSRVRHGSSPAALSLFASDPASTMEHSVVVSGLAAETRYFYSVGTSTATLAGGDSTHFFATAPPPGANRPLRIWATGDSGTANANALAVRDSYLAYAGGRATDVWLMLGDNAYFSGTDAEYQAAVFDAFPGVLRNTFLWPALGNHDGISANSASQTGPFFDIFTLPAAAEAGGVPSGTEAYYSFDVADVHFVCLDSYGISRSATGAMAAWLASDLGANTRSWTIAYWHHPPYSKGSHDSDVETELVEMRQSLVPVLEAGGVDLVLSGHSHAYERSFLLDGRYGISTSLTPAMKKNPGSGREEGSGAYVKRAGRYPHNGTVYVVAGTSGQVGGGSFDHPAMYLSAAELGSLVVDVDGDRLDARFLTSTGTLADHFTLVRSTSFHTIASCRLLDTRLPPGSGGGPALAPGAERLVTVAGRCGIPAFARTIAANVTVTASTAAGWIVLAAGAAAPSATSTLNFRAGQTRANNARASLGPGGSVGVRSGMTAGAVDVVIDVSGYFD
ncbi:MAG: metallophosphoesterase family protein [Acidobacteriota bacterium]|nr:metallophosphoesterase family protein [Acidobacteriota bacterium]